MVHAKNNNNKKKMLKKEILTVQPSLDQTFTPEKPKFKYFSLYNKIAISYCPRTSYRTICVICMFGLKISYKQFM